MQQLSADTEHGVLSGSEWLETHFEACRNEYLAMLRSVGIKSGWSVLDVGCGYGSFLPELIELVGTSGSVDALDPDPRHIASIRGRFRKAETPCPVNAQVGVVTELPFRAGRFDAVWCANVVQYLDDADLSRALVEIHRVVRPGGIVAIKDVDMLLARVAPGDPCLMTRLADACASREGATAQSRGSIRGRDLRRWLERAGFVKVRQQTMLIERWAPLRPVEQRLWHEWLGHLAAAAHDQDLPAHDRETWHGLEDPQRRLELVQNPEFYACEGQTVAVGNVL